MTPVCRRCDEVVDPADRMCASCGADLRVQVPVLLDLTRAQLRAQKERQRLLAEAVATNEDDAVPTTPKARRWGGDSTTLLELEQAPYRVGKAPNADDLLPAPRRRGWRRR